MTESQKPLPKISIVTPVLNQSRYLSEALESVIEQHYPNLEYIVVDGASTDGSAEIVESYGPHLAHRISEPDEGLYDALNKGFAMSSGEIMGWLNADDMYTPWALSVVGEIFSVFPEVSWVTTVFPLFWDSGSRAVRCAFNPRLSREGFFRGENLPGAGRFATGWIQQESTFWRRSLWEAAGGYLDASLKLAGDFDLWTRFYQHTDLYGVGTPLGGFRQHGDQKSVHDMPAYLAEAVFALQRGGGRLMDRVEAIGRKMLARSPVPQRRSKRLKVCAFDTSAGKWRISQEF